MLSSTTLNGVTKSCHSDDNTDNTSPKICCLQSQPDLSNIDRIDEQLDSDPSVYTLYPKDSSKLEV